jgi:hypothetical protein
MERRDLGDGDGRALQALDDLEGVLPGPGGLAIEEAGEEERVLPQLPGDLVGESHRLCRNLARALAASTSR